MFCFVFGQVIFRAENGGGQLVVEYSLEDPLALCDGNWHKIQALKDGNLVRLKVDDGPEREGGGKGSQTNANIYHPLYAGGLPGMIQIAPFTSEFHRGRRGTAKLIKIRLIRKSC